ncbi:MAG: thioredoxin domain-containing protein [Planctomycetota bacterium]|nr:MAG: thioredoxin domain-containing protein [Planctomycetota bacterium]
MRPRQLPFLLGALLLEASLLGFALPAAAQDAPAPKHRNRLAHEKSPYLLQHADNPVDWHPWGPEAFARAKKEQKPIFLSIGYATCHWCHVMERESFENEEVAAYLNEHFVAIKVDREERPDVDAVYMNAVQALTGSGGWPLSVFLTPDGRPFAGGTYFPQPARFGRRSFLEVLRAVHDAWSQRRAELDESAQELTKHLRRVERNDPTEAELGEQAFVDALRQLAAAYDAARGGFPGRGRTQFPLPHLCGLLLRIHARSGDERSRDMALRTLDAIARGGLRDHLAGGFHRYSTDREWSIPHFEKMLYDQAGLLRAFVEAYLLTGRARYADVARETADFVLARMHTSEGAFTSAWDADSEGVEGKCYLWTLAELREALGPDDAELFAARYGVSERGNVPERRGANHLQIEASFQELARRFDTDEKVLRARVAAARRKLLAARDRRAQPLHDDKVLTDWNGLAIGALAYGARGLGEERYARAAAQAADFLLRRLRTRDGALLHRYRDGAAGIPALLADYAFLVWGLVELFEATSEARWLAAARDLADRMVASYWDAKAGGFFQTASGEPLLVRVKPTYDGAIPSGNGAAAYALARLGHACGDRAYTDRAAATLRSYSHSIARAGGSAHALALWTLDLLLGPLREVVVAGPRDRPATQALLATARSGFRPRTLVLWRPAELPEPLASAAPFLGPLVAPEGRPAAYLCEGYACKAPRASAEALRAALGPTEVRAPAPPPTPARER